MSNQTADGSKNHVRKMFGRIAPRYDLLNRLMTFGQDIQWRKILVKNIALPDDPFVLDIGCGTGDLAKEVRKQHPDSIVVAADFTPEMVFLGAKETRDPLIHWVIADAQNLPFVKEFYDAVICGFLLRNVPDVNQTLNEQYRVCRDDARFASLDTTPPEKNRLRPFLNIHLNYFIPFLGWLVMGDSFAYKYLSDSTHQFLDAEKLAEKIRGAGFSKVKYLKKMFKTIAIHWGVK